MLRDVVIEFVETPEVAAGDGEVQPDGERDGSNYKWDGGHRSFWRSMPRHYNGKGNACS
jgi:hypothetical protein